ncbi:unnamed protein product [Lasius platythorax]|uniref:Uncharacterized protein n=1 Tax=Lasius platythorax TaxID=488582 RepID=A0AAV2N0P6_9HYME
MVATTPRVPDEHEMLMNHSSLYKLLRVTAWCRRWLPVCRNDEVSSQTESKGHGFTTVSQGDRKRREAVDPLDAGCQLQTGVKGTGSQNFFLSLPKQLSFSISKELTHQSESLF